MVDGVFTRQIPWTRQPQYLINKPGSYIGIGSSRLTDNGKVLNVTDGNALTMDVGPQGRNIVFNGSIARLVGSNRNKRFGVSLGFTVVVIYRWDTLNGAASAALIGTSASVGESNGNGWTLQAQVFSSNAYLGFRNSGGTGGSTNATDLITAPDSTTHICAVRVIKGGNVTLFQDGVQSTVTNTITLAAPPHFDFYLGGRLGDPYNFRFTGAISFVACIPDAFTNDYVRNLTINPWQLLQPITQYIPYTTAVGGRTASGANTLANFISAGISKVAIAAASAITLAAFTSAAAATVLVQASGTSVLEDYTSSGVVSTAISASAANILEDYISVGVSTVAISASASNTLANHASAGTSTVLLQAAAADTLEDFTSTGVAATALSASAANILEDFTSAGVSLVAITASGASTLASYASSSTSKVLVQASAANTLAAFVSAGVAVADDTRTASAANVLADFISAGTSTVAIVASAANVLADFASAGVATVGITRTASAANILEDYASTGTARLVVTASAAVVLEDYISAAVVVVTDPYTPSYSPVSSNLALRKGILPRVENLDDVYEELVDLNNSVDLLLDIRTADITTAGVEANRLSIDVHSVDHTLILINEAKLQKMTSSSANNLIVPPNSIQPFPFAPSAIIPVVQYGVGVTTIVEGAGVTIRTPTTLVLTQYKLVRLIKIGVNEWLLEV